MDILEQRLLGIVPLMGMEGVNLSWLDAFIGFHTGINGGDFRISSFNGSGTSSFNRDWKLENHAWFSSWARGHGNASQPYW